MKRALVIGSNGTIGSALAKIMHDQYDLETLNQNQTDYSDDSLRALAEGYKKQGRFSTIICCIGTLHNDIVEPEKRLNALSEDKLSEYFRVNTILPALCMKAFAPLLMKDETTQFSFLSAMVGSIGDNNLGGWYGYRSSKAALNMMIRTGAIELSRTHKKAALAAIHPGTTKGPLSKPFASNVSQDKYYSPQQTAERVLTVTRGLKAEQTGSFFNWDGKTIPW